MTLVRGQCVPLPSPHALLSTPSPLLSTPLLSPLLSLRARRSALTNLASHQREEREKEREEVAWRAREDVTDGDGGADGRCGSHEQAETDASAQAAPWRGL